MTIRVEFFGIARQRAGKPYMTLPVPGPVSLETVLDHLAAQLPDFAAECLQGNRLLPRYVANLDGERFVCDPNTQLAENTCLLIMSADAGG